MDSVGHSGSTESVWMATEPVRQFPQLSRDINRVDVCVVGAGISGLTTAFLLAIEGKTVVVVDDGPIAGGETERTTAHITNVIDNRYFEIVRMHGIDKARIAAQSLTYGVDAIEAIVTTLDIDCDFQRLDGYLFLGEGDAVDILENEYKAATELGLTGVEFVYRLPSGLKVPALRFAKQAQFHVLKYLNALCDSIERHGGRIFSYEHVASIKDGRHVVVTTDSGNRITASNLVIATNSPISDRVKVHTKQAAYRTYAIGIRVLKGTVPAALYWDTETPYHYIRLAPLDSETHELLIVGGEDHRTGEAHDADLRFTRLEQWTRKRLAISGKVEYRWSGQVYEPVDGIGYIGRDPAHGENVFITTGDSGMGMTHGTIAGILLTDLIFGRENPWKELYDPSRKALAAPIKYLKETANTMAQYAKVLMPAEVSNINQILPGEGAILRQGGQQVAIYKDKDGFVHKMSARCPHLGATVCWNSCEKTWDCPAHGSRFNTEGQVVNGPANNNLDDQDKPETRIA